METMKHTPGPWEPSLTVGGPKDRPAYIVWSKNGTNVAEVNPLRDEHFNGQGRANAALIAAAPELHTALKLAITILGEQSDISRDADVYRLADAALLKADGRPATTRAKHTPGPWREPKAGATPDAAYYAARIAAAPDLLAALRQVVLDPESAKTTAAVMAAIAKAEGRTV